MLTQVANTNHFLSFYAINISKGPILELLYRKLIIKKGIDHKGDTGGVGTVVINYTSVLALSLARCSGW